MPTSLRWPASLPQVLPQESQFKPAENFIESPMDMGPPKRRRRSAIRWGTIDVPEGAFILLEDQWVTLRHFYEQVLADGTLSFMWLDPIPGFGDAELRFERDSLLLRFRRISGRQLVSRSSIAFQVMPS